MSVVEALEEELKAISAIAPDVAGSALAASALVLAAELDSAGNSATSKSMCARALTETLEKLRERLPEQDRKDSKLDELRARRARRVGGAGS